MRIYEEDSDAFTTEYLDYLDTLTTEVYVLSNTKVRITRGPSGDIVRWETWSGDGTYADRYLPGWMKP